MLGLLLACFLVGLFIVMLFSEEGRGCLFAGIGITLLGAVVIVGAIYLLIMSF